MLQLKYKRELDENEFLNNQCIQKYYPYIQEKIQYFHNP